MKWVWRLAAVALFTPLAHSQTIFSDDFDDAAGATRWSAPIVDAEFGVVDSSVEYSFDYSTVGIPAAPGGGGTLGVRMFSNKTDETAGDEGESIVILANGVTVPSGDFTFAVDVYYKVLAGFEDVATEYVGLGAFAGAPNAPGDPGLNDDAPFRFSVSNGNGLAWQVTGDGGSATDLVRFEDPNNANAGSQTGLGSLDAIPFGTIPGVTTGAGNPNNPFEQFGFQNRWVTLSIESAAGMISYKINGATIDTIDNTGGVFAGGTILLNLNDAFNSAAGDGVYTVFDNVRLAAAVPEPCSMVLLALAVLGPAVRRRW